jgi:O-antigen/teichoic acid export membrane protein
LKIQILNKFYKIQTDNNWGVKANITYMAFSYLTTSLLTFIYQMLAVRLLQPEQYGVVTVLYSSILILLPFMGQTFELTLCKYVSSSNAKDENSLPLIRNILFWQVTVMLLFVLLSVLLRDVIIERLFPEAPYFYYIFIASGMFWGLELAARGIIRGLQDFKYYGAFAVTMNLSRIGFLLLLTGVAKKGLVGAGLSILIASWVNILLFIFWYLKSGHRLKGVYKPIQISRLELLKSIGPTMVFWGCVAYFQSIGPVLIKLFADQRANELAGLFLVASMIVRLPLTLSDALFSNLFPQINRSLVQRDWTMIKYYINKSYQLLIPLLLFTIIGIYFLGPTIIRWFSPEFSYERFGLTLLMVSTSIIILAAVYNQFLLARQETLNMVIFGWFMGSFVLTASVLLIPGNILHRIEISYLLSSTVIWVLLAIFTKREINRSIVLESHIS